MYDVVIIGAGVAGTSIARELSRYKLKIAVIDRENDVANETTMANSAIIHAGYDAEPYKNKGKFNAKGNAMYTQLAEDLDIPFKRVGSLVLAFSEADLATIELLYERGIENGVPDQKLLTKEEVLEMEPNINDTIFGALYAPTAGIVSSWEVAIACMENAMDNGAELFLNTTVEDITKDGDVFTVKTDQQDFQAKYVVNAAGVFSDKVNNMIAAPTFEIQARKGQYFIMDKDIGNLVNTVLFQCPSDVGKGILVAPTVHGNLLIGPDSVFVDDREDVSTTAPELAMIREAAALTTSKIDNRKVIRSFSGLRATSTTHDFVLGETPDVQGFFNVGGFESPGLSAAPAVAVFIADQIKERNGGFEANPSFNPVRRPFIRFDELDAEEKAALVKENPLYGRVICRCETVTEGEIMDSIHRNVGATTVKSVKKRTRAGMGRCQGGFCEPRVIEILSRELGKSMNQVSYDSPKAYILTGRTKNVEE